MKLKRLPAGLGLLLLVLALPSVAQANYLIKDANGVTQTIISTTVGGSQLPQSTPSDATGTPFSAGNPPPLPTGAASAANQSTSLGNQASELTDIGPPGATACATDTGSCSVNALLQRLAQRLSTLIAGGITASSVGITQTDVSANGVEIAPTAAAAAGTVSVVSAAAEASHIIKASAGNLYGFQVTSGAVAGYVLVFNLTSAPANGAVTPIKCLVLPANSSLMIDYRPGPMPYFGTGITIEFSTTGCFTATSSATAFISADAK